jgi:hypothetical protein
MKRLVFVALPILLATPALAADYDRPSYSEREYYERRVEREAPPRIVEREVLPPKIVEHHHYHHHKVAPRVYTEERIYREPRAYVYYDKPFHHYKSWRPRHRFWDRPWRHHHHRHHW